jgi:hypothetical protein
LQKLLTENKKYDMFHSNELLSVFQKYIDTEWFNILDDSRAAQPMVWTGMKISRDCGNCCGNSFLKKPSIYWLFLL